MSWRGRRVLVTGAGGFIGSHLVERLLSEGAQVRALVHYHAKGDWGNLEEIAPPLLEGAEVLLGDVRDPHLVRRAAEGREVVFHLAALIGIPYSYAAPASYVETNVTGTLHVLQACVDAKVSRVVHTSTSEVYGTARTVPITEAHPLSAQSPYAASKIGADQMALAYHRTYGLPVVVLRPFNTYGPRQSLRAVIPTIMMQALQGGEVRLGSLHPTRDFTYVADTVDAFLKAASSEAACGQVVHAGTGREIAIGDLARSILALAGGGARLLEDSARVRPQASEVERLVADPALARHLLGWTPGTPLEEGLRRTLAWCRERAAKRPARYAV